MHTCKDCWRRPAWITHRGDRATEYVCNYHLAASIHRLEDLPQPEYDPDFPFTTPVIVRSFK